MTNTRKAIIETLRNFKDLSREQQEFIKNADFAESGVVPHIHK
jgi:hypothetical protein